ncbi:phosphate-binding protein [Clostridia bacterium]|nr:phosphate-binding protein [Clostridia bacterium]
MRLKKAVVSAVAVVCAVSVLAGCAGTGGNSAGGDVSGTVKTGGSTSVEKVMTSLIYQFQDENRGVTVNYEMNGSGDGIKNTLSGLYEIGHSSRELKSDGTEDGLNATAYAIDGIVLVMNKGNSVTDLSKEQVRDIFTGKVSNWKDVGGSDSLITVVTREASSGTRNAFAEIVGLEKADSPETAIASTATVCDSTGAIQTTVIGNANAIGYMSFSDADAEKVNIAAFGGVSCTADSLRDGSYTLKRNFYLITKKGAVLSAAAEAFAAFITGAEGQKIVAMNKLLPV